MVNNDQIVTAGAIGAVTSPAWLPALYEASHIAGAVAPILGSVWLALQIGIKIYQTFFKKEAKDG